MSEENKCCDTCGNDIPHETPGGLCPNCLIGIANLKDTDCINESISFPATHHPCPNCQSDLPLVTEGGQVECFQCGQTIIDLTETVAETPHRIGRFTVVEKLGAGQFGVVWKAHDPELDRDVAIKVPRSLINDTKEIEAFMREARATAQLSHPNIARVHEVGRDDDTIYIVTDLIEGMPLDQWLENHRITEKQAATLCVTIADAVAHAHSHGIIHRDLKPGNILLDNQGQPHLVDFGLAKRNASEITVTMEGKVLGTPAYMPPEQAQGDSHQATECSDVYALGVILFELLTGELPFRGNLRMVLHQILTQEATNPRKLNDKISKDIETVCLKCLEKAPNNRYRSANEVASELGNYLKGHPIAARPVGRITKVVRWCNRHRGLAAAIGITFIAVFSAISIIAIAVYSIDTERKHGVSRLRESAQLLRAEARELIERGETDKALTYLARACRQEPDSILAAEIASSILNGSTPLPFTFERYSPQFVGNGERFITESDNNCSLRNAEDGKLISVILGITPILCPVGNTLLTMTDNGIISLWDAHNGAFIANLADTENTAQALGCVL